MDGSVFRIAMWAIFWPIKEIMGYLLCRAIAVWYGQNIDSICAAAFGSRETENVFGKQLVVSESSKVHMYLVRDLSMPAMATGSESGLFMVMIVCQTYPQSSQVSKLCLQIVMLHLEHFVSVRTEWVCARVVQGISVL